ncbi:MAG: winged helix-turn-helix domain-containing protein [Candidatus Micrarchaeota archaeon]|nr:winged helix-turn-helix domain-containing protein [Candidatus Micrarchaeota archaeon]
MHNFIDKETAQILNNEIRKTTLKELTKRPFTLSELSINLKTSKTNMNTHLRKLESIGLIIKTEGGRKWKYYSITEKGKKLSSKDMKIVYMLLSSSIICTVVLSYVLFLETTYAIQNSITDSEVHSLPYGIYLIFIPVFVLFGIKFLWSVRELILEKISSQTLQQVLILSQK